MLMRLRAEAGLLVMFSRSAGVLGSRIQPAADQNQNQNLQLRQQNIPRLCL